MVLLLTATGACLTVPAEAEEPSLTITEPRQGDALKGVVTIAVRVNTAEAIDHVTVLADGEVLGADALPPYRVEWDTRRAADGPYVLTARARNRASGTALSSRCSVTVDNTPPSVAWSSPAEGSAIGGVVALEAQAGDIIGIAAVRFLVNGEAVGEATTAPYVVSWDSTTLPNVRCSLVARAFDRAKNMASSHPVIVKLSNPSRPPVVEPLAPLTLKELQPVSLAIRAKDPDGARDPLRYTALRLPEWLHLDEKTGELHGIPGPQECSKKSPRKDYDVVFSICDPEPLCTKSPWAVTVTDHNSPPQIDSPGDQTVDEAEPLTARFVTSDPEDDPLICKVSGLPPWTKFDSATCTISGSPGPKIATLAEPKTVYDRVRVEVCDPEPLCATAKITITVNDTQNRAPVFDPIKPQTVDEGRSLKLAVRAVDADEDAVYLSAKPLPDGAAFEDRSDRTGLLTWSPRFDQSGHYTISLKATDGALITTETLEVTVREMSVSISGYIQDYSTGLPLRDATVTLSAFGTTLQHAKTDAKGYYLLKGVSPGTYQVTPTYELKRETTLGAAVKLRAVSFNPTGAKVTVKDRDETDVDFAGTPPE